MKIKRPAWAPLPQPASTCNEDTRTAASAAAEVAVYRTTRVAKRINPTDPGARKLARVYGDALVCVRHRHDERASRCYITVELVIERRPLVRRTDLAESVHVRIGFHETELHVLAARQGATWDDRTCLWRMPLRLAKKLGLLHRLVEN